MVISLVKTMHLLDNILYQKTKETLLGNKQELKMEVMTLDLQAKQRTHLKIQRQ